MGSLNVPEGAVDICTFTVGGNCRVLFGVARSATTLIDQCVRIAAAVFIQTIRQMNLKCGVCG
jgi:hypothetical protein